MASEEPKVGTLGHWYRNLRFMPVLLMGAFRPEETSTQALTRLLESTQGTSEGTWQQGLADENPKPLLRHLLEGKPFALTAEEAKLLIFSKACIPVTPLYPHSPELVKQLLPWALQQKFLGADEVPFYLNTFLWITTCQTADITTELLGTGIERHHRHILLRALGLDALLHYPNDFKLFLKDWETQGKIYRTLSCDLVSISQRPVLDCWTTYLQQGLIEPTIFRRCAQTIPSSIDDLEPVLKPEDLTYLFDEGTEEFRQRHWEQLLKMGLVLTSEQQKQLHALGISHHQIGNQLL